MRKKAAVIANTGYHLFVALQMKMTVLKDIDVDLYISDHRSDNTLQYVRDAKKLKMFNDVKYLESQAFVSRAGKYEKNNMLTELLFSLGRFHEVKKKGAEIEKYDYFFTATLNYFDAAFYEAVKKKNKKVKLYLFEDGTSVYKSIEVHLKRLWDEFHNGEYRNIYNITGFGRAYDEIKGVFMFCPELFSWDKKMKIYGIPKMDKNNLETIKKINILFGYNRYKKVAEKAKEKNAIFFEGPFSYQLNDVELVDVIGETLGKDNVMVKLHPVSRKSRFGGIDIFPVSSIPWEVFYLNNDFSNMTMVSGVSGSVINPFRIFSDNSEVVILVLDETKGEYSDMMASLRSFLFEKVFSVHPNVFHVVYNKEELKEYFSQRYRGNSSV